MYFAGDPIKPTEGIPETPLPFEDGCSFEGTYDNKPCFGKVGEPPPEPQQKPCFIEGGTLWCGDDGDASATEVGNEAKKCFDLLSGLEPGESKRQIRYDRFCTCAEYYVRGFKTEVTGSGAKIGGSSDIGCIVTREPEKK